VKKYGSSLKSTKLLPLTSVENNHLKPLQLKNITYFLLVIFTFFGISGKLGAQTFTVEVQIKNQPADNIIFGSVKGDDFIAIDSTSLIQTFGKIKFAFPQNAHAGIYRIVFGQTPAAKILNEPPQKLDFIFDDENIVFDTDFKSPEESLKIIQSKENNVWFSFIAKDKLIKANIEMLGKEIDNYWQKGDTANVIDLANEFNQLQMELDNLVVQTSQENRGLFASLLIKNLREPLLDGYLTPVERNQSFKKEFFKTLDFTDPLLINSSVYTDNIFTYLVRYNKYDYTQKQREAEYIKALDIIVPNINQNDEVYKFLMAYLVHGFKVLQMENIISYISKEYNFPE